MRSLQALCYWLATVLSDDAGDFTILRLKAMVAIEAEQNRVIVQACKDMFGMRPGPNLCTYAPRVTNVICSLPKPPPRTMGQTDC